MDCPFCEIDRNKTRIIEEKTQVSVILSNPKLMFGHLLVIPKKHVEKLSELDESSRKELLETVMEYQEKILSKISKGCDISQHYRPFIQDSKFKVSHLHFHILPRKFKDELYHKSQIFHESIFKDLTKEETNKLFRLLK